MDDKDLISKLLTDLPRLARAQLAELWERHFGNPPNPRLRSELMRPVLAYRIQEKSHGSSSKIMTHGLPRSLTGRFKTGTRIVREWKGKIHEVSVTQEGYEHDGKTYKSLSPIASHITGTKWSGPAFFGTKPVGREK